MLSRVKPLFVSPARRFHAGKPKSSSLDVESSKEITKYYHTSGIVLAVLTPIAFLLPSSATLPLDLALGLAFPLHSHVAINYVITDYVPKGARSAARAGLLGATIVAIAGLLKLNIQGPGLTETFKSLWRKPAKK